MTSAPHAASPKTSPDRKTQRSQKTTRPKPRSRLMMISQPCRAPNPRPERSTLGRDVRDTDVTPQAMAREPTSRLSGNGAGSLARRAGSGDISEVAPLGKRASPVPGTSPGRDPVPAREPGRPTAPAAGRCVPDRHPHPPRGRCHRANATGTRLKWGQDLRFSSSSRRACPGCSRRLPLEISACHHHIA